MLCHTFMLVIHNNFHYPTDLHLPSATIDTPVSRAILNNVPTHRDSDMRIVPLLVQRISFG